MFRRNQDPLKKVDREAWISPEHSFATRPCRVTGMSVSEARLRCKDESFLSKRFRLKFEQGGTRGRLCELTWRKGMEAGVRFIPESAGPGPR